MQAPSPEKRRLARSCGERKCHSQMQVFTKSGGIEKESAENRAFVCGHGCEKGKVTPDTECLRNLAFS